MQRPQHRNVITREGAASGQSRAGTAGLREDPPARGRAARHDCDSPDAAATTGTHARLCGYCHSMPRISAFYGVVIYMYWNERDDPVAHFHAYHAGRAPRCPPTGPCWPAASNREHSSLSWNGRLFGTRKSSRTGNGPATASPCFPYRPCPRMMSVSENYMPTVTGVAVIGERVLRLLFSDGTVGDVDFSG